MHLFLFCPILVKQGFSFSERLCTHYWSDFLFSVKQGYSFSKRILYSTSVYAPSLVQCTFSSIITNLVWIGTGCTYSCGRPAYAKGTFVSVNCILRQGTLWRKKFSRSLMERGDEGDTKGNKEKIEWQ